MKRMLWLLIALALPTVAHSQNAPAKPTREQILKAAGEVIQAARYCTFITVDEAGQPQARVVDPFAPDSNMTIWIGTKSTTRKVAQLRHNPRATMLCYDPQKMGYVTLLGTAEVVTDAADKAKHWKPDWKQFYQDENRGPDYVLIRLKPARLEILSGAHGLMNDPKTWLPVVLEL